ncbi:MAG: hypothetical protein IPM54_45355 [Polyangiaceae bacterium]|nr:hypothetical protein [Polyangiaceae bacterium]
MRRRFMTLIVMGKMAFVMGACSEPKQARDTGEIEVPPLLCPEVGPATGEHVQTRTFVVDTKWRTAQLQVGVDASGNTIVAGSFRGSVDPGNGVLPSAGGYDVFAAKLDRAGNVLWSKRFGNFNDEMLRGLGVTTSGDVYLAIDSLESFFIVKLDADGVEGFAHKYIGGEYQYLTAAAVDWEGNLLIAGRYEGRNLNLGLGPIGAVGNIFLAKIDNAGNTLFAKAITKSVDSIVNDLAAAPDGDILLTGDLKGAINVDGVAAASDGGTDALLARFDPHGRARWMRRFGSHEWDSGLQVAVDGLGKIWHVGSYEDIVDVGTGPLVIESGSEHLLLELDAAGRHRRHFFAAPHVEADGAGNVILAGQFKDVLEPWGAGLTSAGEDDVYLVKLGANGNETWARSIGGPTSEMLHDVAVACTGQIAVVGSVVDPSDPNWNDWNHEGPLEVFVSTFAP